VYLRCYYGEYPLSFAASVGNVKICKILYQSKLSRIKSPDEFEKEGSINLERKGDETDTKMPRALDTHSTFLEFNKHHSVKTKTDPMWRFLNACDTFGNTAMHMAVIHRRKEVVDWLMTTKEGRDNLNTLNFDGFTPLTLAARHGFVEMFHHILYTHMSKVAWRYGKVREARLILRAHGAP
jgi:ankyrin repeat protein